MAELDDILSLSPKAPQQAASKNPLDAIFDLGVEPGTVLGIPPTGVGDTGELTPARAFARGAVGGATFGVGEFVPSVRELEAEAFEERPITTLAGTIFGSLVGLPKAAAAGISALFKGIPQAVRAAKTAKNLQQIVKQAPGAGKVMLQNLAERPGAVAEAAAAFSLVEAETGNLNKALVAGALPLGATALIKGASLLTSGGVRAIRDPDVQQFISFAIENPKDFARLTAGALGKNAKVLTTTVMQAEKQFAAVAAKAQEKKLKLGRSFIDFFRRTKRQLNDDFGKATSAFLEKAGDSPIQINETVQELTDLLQSNGLVAEGKIIQDAHSKLQARGLDDTILDVYEQLTKKVKPGEPSFITLRELVDIKNLAQDASKFSRLAGAKEGLNAAGFGIIRGTIDDQAKEYSNILSRYAKSRQPLDALQDLHRASKTISPGKKIDSIYGNAEQEAFANNLFTELIEGIATEDPTLAKAIQVGTARMQRLGKGAIIVSQLTKALGKNVRLDQAQKAFLALPLEELNNPVFRALANNNPVIKKAQQQVQVFSLAEKFLLLGDELGDEAATFLARFRVAVTGAARKSVIKQIAARNPQATRKITQLLDFIETMDKPAKNLVRQFFKGFIPTGESLTKAATIAFESPQNAQEFKKRMQIGLNYAQNVRETGSFDPTRPAFIFGPNQPEETQGP